MKRRYYILKDYRRRGAIGSGDRMDWVWTVAMRVPILYYCQWGITKRPEKTGRGMMADPHTHGVGMKPWCGLSCKFWAKTSVEYGKGGGRQRATREAVEKRTYLDFSCTVGSLLWFHLILFFLVRMCACSAALLSVPFTYKKSKSKLLYTSSDGNHDNINY